MIGHSNKQITGYFFIYKDVKVTGRECCQCPIVQGLKEKVGSGAMIEDSYHPDNLGGGEHLSEGG